MREEGGTDDVPTAAGAFGAQLQPFEDVRQRSDRASDQP